MSLKVWLPLNGDLENKGTSNVNITANGATVNTSGKIGSCYSFDGSDDYISLDSPVFYDIIKGGTQPFSIAMWIYHNDSTRAILFGDYSLSGAINFNIELTTAHQVRFYWNGSPDKNFDSNSSVGAQTWTHIALTYDGSQLLLYKNGAVISDKYSGALAVKTKSSGAYYLGRDSRTGSTALSGRLNDFRLYDHCLSALEVKEIAQGLILHYKLDGEFCGINYNLAYGSKLLATTATVSNKNISKRGTPTLGTRSDGFVQTECTASWQGFSLWSNALNLTVGTTYTYSFYGYTNSTNNTNAAISFYPMMYNSAGTRDTTSTLPISVQGGSFTNANAKQIGQLNTTPTLYWATFTWNQTMADIITNNGKIELSIQVHGTLTEGRIDYLWAPKLEIGNKPTGWVPSIEEMGIDVTKIEDSSGYNNNGTVTGTTIITEDSPRYSLAISMNNTSTTNHIESINDITLSDNISVSFWVKASKSTSQVIFSTKNIQFGILNNLGYVLPSSAAGYQLTDFVTNSWNHICVVKNAGTFTLYVNGNKPARSGSNNYYVHNVDKLWLFNRSYNSSYGANASISDFRFYATPLLDNDVISLYNVGMKIDNQQQVHTFEGFEQLSNIMYKPNLAIGAQEWKDGLNRYQQSNCQVSLTKNGVHVYRPANLSQANDGNTMYGGLKIVNSTADTVHAYDSTIDNIFNLQKNHTYVWIFYVKGSTTNAPGFQVTNNMGWGGGGLTPSPSNVEIKNIPTNFDGETEIWYKFTISDDIVKTCTSSYSSFVANTQYLSYKHFGWNWSYATTGNGTDIYITNIRLYDITDIPIGKLTKTGITKFSSIFEVNDSIHITKNEDLIVNQFIER